jgi:Protein of unknown function (DUF2985)
VELTSQIENGLFTLTGIGLIPVRTIDTYREPVCFIHLVDSLKSAHRHVQNMGLQASHEEVTGKSWFTSIV